MSEAERGLTEQEASDVIRSRVLAGIHGGHLRPGDRLPTYREVAGETGLDLRAVARIYRALEEERLVEIRGRSGVFIPEPERVGDELLSETFRWMVGVFREAWMRRIGVPNFADFARRLVASRSVRCACIESTEDHLHWLCAELTEACGYRTEPVPIDRLGLSEAPNHRAGTVPLAVAEAELLVTTTFHGPTLRPFARAVGKPLVVVKMDPASARRVERVLSEGELPVITLDSRVVDRLRLVVGDAYADRLRGVRADDREAIARLDRDRPILVSSAARERLEGVELPPQVVTGPAIAPESSEELIAVLIRLNLDALDTAS